jgi:hypothetical protein
MICDSSPVTPAMNQIVRITPSLSGEYGVGVDSSESETGRAWGVIEFDLEPVVAASAVDSIITLAFASAAFRPHRGQNSARSGRVPPHSHEFTDAIRASFRFEEVSLPRGMMTVQENTIVA